jgi:hypothetical protein
MYCHQSQWCSPWPKKSCGVVIGQHQREISQIIHLNRLFDSESPLETLPMLVLGPVHAPLPSLRLLAHGGKV